MEIVLCEMGLQKLRVYEKKGDVFYATLANTNLRSSCNT